MKSLTIIEGHVTKTNGGTHPTTMDASTIINSHLNEDNEFIITLPTKQVLRFATPKEVHKISGKFLEEKKAFIKVPVPIVLVVIISIIIEHSYRRQVFSIVEKVR